jgi:hypothetical protein
MKPLDCVGTKSGVGRHDFHPSGEIVHGTGKPSEASELAAVTGERDALAQELREIQRVAQTYNQPDRRDLWKWLNEVGDIAAKALAKLANGELRESP